MPTAAADLGVNQLVARARTEANLKVFLNQHLHASY